MLVLSRKSGDTIYIGEDIIVTVLEVRGNQIRLGIKAPNTVEILRGELHQVLRQPWLEAAPSECESGGT